MIRSGFCSRGGFFSSAFIEQTAAVRKKDPLPVFIGSGSSGLLFYENASDQMTGIAVMSGFPCGVS